MKSTIHTDKNVGRFQAQDDPILLLLLQPRLLSPSGKPSYLCLWGCCLPYSDSLLLVGCSSIITSGAVIANCSTHEIAQALPSVFFSIRLLVGTSPPYTLSRTM